MFFCSYVFMILTVPYCSVCSSVISYCITNPMNKVGVMLMGKNKEESPRKVKEIVLQVEGKTKMSNIAEYLLEMGKIKDTNVEFALQKHGQVVSDSSNITQALKYATPVKGTLRLYLYEKEISSELLKPEEGLGQEKEKKDIEEIEVKKEQKDAETSKQQLNIRQVEQAQPTEVKPGMCCC